jgi:uncharacterized protein YndB with AHSA1/START domain
MSPKTSTTRKPKQGTEIVINRIFDALRERVWQFWTEPEYVKRWWGPKGFTTPVSQIDFRVGGKYFTCMRSPEGKDFYSTGVYREIVKLERIAVTDSFADEKGNIVSASHYGFEGEFPMETSVTVTFAEQNGKTRMTLTHVGLPAGEMSDQCKDGWNEMFDKLADSLE